jgi:hypothetical protein
MPQYHDTVPVKDSEFDPWFLNLKNYVVEKTGGASPAWTHIPAAKVTELTARYDSWHPAFETMAGPHTKVDTEHKQNERRAAEGFLRPFIAQYLKFDPVSDEDRTAMGVHNKDTHPTHQPAPVSQPDTDVRNTKNHFEHEVRALNSSGDAVKPDDAYGVRFGWQLGGERPATGADLPRSAFKRGVSFLAVYTEADKGKTAYYATCYENSKGDQGPWSPVVEAIIG